MLRFVALLVCFSLSFGISDSLKASQIDSVSLHQWIQILEEAEALFAKEKLAEDFLYENSVALEIASIIYTQVTEKCSEDIQPACVLMHYHLMDTFRQFRRIDWAVDIQDWLRNHAANRLLKAACSCEKCMVYIDSKMLPVAFGVGIQRKMQSNFNPETNTP